MTTSTNLRVAPSTSASVIAELAAGTTIDVVCWVRGEPTYGAGLHGSMWLLTTLGGWVHSYQVTPVNVGPC